jgi:hypothetical protein
LRQAQAVLDPLHEELLGPKSCADYFPPVFGRLV